MEKTLPHLLIISPSIRVGRNSPRVAAYIQHVLEEKSIATSEIIDLLALGIPLVEERLSFMKNPPELLVQLSEKLKNCQGVIIIVPEYNGSFPASLKNFIDLYYAEWNKKPVGFCTVSTGDFGGVQSIVSLQFVLWKMKAWTIAPMMVVPNVVKALDEDGNVLADATISNRAMGMIKELLWAIDAKKKMEA